MVDENVNTTKVRRVEPKEGVLLSPLDGPYLRYLL